MKIGLLINSAQKKKNQEFEKIVMDIIDQIGSVKKIDMASGKALHEIYYEIRDERANLWITWEGAGFELRTENDTLSLNNIYGRMIHILWNPIKEYQNILCEQFNFSMFLYVRSKQDMELIRKCNPNIPNVGLLPKLDSDMKVEQKREIVYEWFLQVLSECELLQMIDEGVLDESLQSV